LALRNPATTVQVSPESPEELPHWNTRNRDITGYDILQFMRRVQ